MIDQLARLRRVRATPNEGREVQVISFDMMVDLSDHVTLADGHGRRQGEA